MIILTGLFFLSCQKESRIPPELIGIWYGTTYDDIGAAYLKIEFEENGTGEFCLETSSNNFGIAYFEYTISGNNIKCKGAYASSFGDGNINDDFSLTLKFDKDRIIPTSNWSSFILTQDGSIETDIYGNEVSNQSDLLRRVWVSEDGMTVFDFRDSKKAHLYELVAPYSKQFSWATTYEYTYYYKRKEIDFVYGTGKDTQVFYYTITQLDNSTFILKNQNGGSILKYKGGSESDLPTEFVNPLKPQ